METPTWDIHSSVVLANDRKTPTTPEFNRLVARCERDGQICVLGL